MRMIISPAKKMNTDIDGLDHRQLPGWLAETEQLLRQLQGMSYDELKSLWKCNDAIAQLNDERIRRMKLTERLTPAIYAYEGIQYQYMAPGVFSKQELDYLEEHLRILSGFYGILRPLDGVVPYRLEMQAKLAGPGFRSLYEFWGRRLADALFSETDCIINLASKEYSKCITPYLGDSIRFVTCVFGQHIGGKIVEKGTLVKMARGEMVRYMTERQVVTLEEIKHFDRMEFKYDEMLSDEHTYVFIQNQQ